jgi:hypothetical protein
MSYLYFLLLGSLLFTACGSDDPAPPTLSAPTVTGLFQPEGQLSISFTITGTFQTGNIFTAQLSDATGSFANALAIGTLNSLTAGTINATLPATVANGTAYRIRVVASTPPTTSPDNGSNLNIAAPTISAPTVAGVFQPDGQLTINFTTTGTFKTGNVFTAQLSNGTGNFSNPTVIGTLNSLTAGTINTTLPATVANGTAYRIRIVASTPPTTSPDNGANLSIAVPTITISSVTTANANETFIPGRNLIITTALTGTFGTGNQFKLQLSDAAGNFSSATVLTTITNTVLDASLTGSFLPTSTQAGTGYRYRWVSTNPAINGTPSNPISVVLLSLSTPVVTGNLVAGGDILVSVNASNGPWFNSNQLRIELSDATGSFTNPIGLRTVNTMLAGSQQTQSLTMTIPVNTPAGAGYRIRAITASPVVTSSSSTPFAIGALPTISLAVGTPAFTKLYSGKTYSTTYTLNISKTGTFNTGTSFGIAMSNSDQTFASGNFITVAVLSTAQITELQNSGSTVVTMFLRDLGNGSRRLRVITNGHGSVVSNELQMNVTQLNLNSLSGNIDTQTINFGTNLAAYTTNTPSSRNNQELLLVADEPTTMFGATTVRMFIVFPLTSENVPTGTQTGRLVVHFLNAAEEQIAIYSNAAVSMNISGSPTAYTVAPSGTNTLTRTSGTAGNTTISLQFVSASFRVQ